MNPFQTNVPFLYTLKTSENQKLMNKLTHFTVMFPFYTPKNHQKTLTFSRTCAYQGGKKCQGFLCFQGVKKEIIGVKQGLNSHFQHIFAMLQTMSGFIHLLYAQNVPKTNVFLKYNVNAYIRGQEMLVYWKSLCTYYLLWVIPLEDPKMSVTGCLLHTHTYIFIRTTFQQLIFFNNLT